MKTSQKLTKLPPLYKYTYFSSSAYILDILGKVICYSMQNIIVSYIKLNEVSRIFAEVHFTNKTYLASNIALLLMDILLKDSVKAISPN